MSQAKRITVNKKLLDKVTHIFSMKFGLHDVTEFEEIQKDLFQEGPDQWTDLEKAICDYNGRKNYELRDAIKELLENPSKK